MHITELGGITLDIEVIEIFAFRTWKMEYQRRHPNKRRRNIWLNLRTRGPANLGTFVSLLNEITSLNVPRLGVILVLDMEEKII